MTLLEQCLSILEEIAYLEDNGFKKRAYQNAISILKQKGDASFERRNHFADIPGIGKSIESKLLEFKVTGTIEKLAKLRKEHPNRLDPKLFKVRDHYITKRIPYKDAMDLYSHLKDIINVDESNITLCGSARRKSPLIGDLDIVISTIDKSLLSKLKSRLTNAGYKITVSGDKKLSFILRKDTMTPCDVYVTDPNTYWFMVNYLTGSKNHNIKLRGIAKKLGLILNQYGLFDKSGNSTSASSEYDIYNALGIKYVNPEDR